MWKLALLLIPCLLGAADSGASLFRIHCAPCHGADGSGGRGANLAVPKLPHAPDDIALSRVITVGIPGTQMPGTRMTAGENRELVAFVRGLYRSRATHVEGDRNHGEQLFWGKAGCGQCHTVGDRGGRMGPDLTDIGARRGPEFLRTALVDPEAEVPETFSVYRRVIYMPDNFLLVRVVTRDGARILGVRVNEDTFSIQVRDFADRIYSFRKEELRELDEDWGKSPMPSYRKLPEAEIRDLVAYLVSLQGVQ